MNDALFEQWIYASEGDALDFKRDQYKFIGASDEEKSELLKDIIAMANAWRQGIAYIVIGIEDCPVKPNVLHGIIDHIDDASIQEFVKSKVASICRFEYISYTFQGKSYGVIRIPIQKRPVFLLKKYGKLVENAVYVRRGSSTLIANPAEVADMGKEVVDERVANLNIEIYDREVGKPVGNSIKFSTRFIGVSDSIPDYEGRERDGFFNAFDMPNKGYYRETMEYVNFRLAFAELCFSLINTGDKEAVNIRIEIEFPVNSVDILLDNEEVRKPQSDKISSITALPVSMLSRFNVEKYKDRWLVSTHVERLHAKRTIDLGGMVYIKARASGMIKVKVVVYFDGESVPKEQYLEVVFACDNCNISWADAVQFIQQSGL